MSGKHWFPSQPSTNDSRSVKELFPQFRAEFALQSLANPRPCAAFTSSVVSVRLLSRYVNVYASDFRSEPDVFRIFSAENIEQFYTFPAVARAQFDNFGVNIFSCAHRFRNDHRNVARHRREAADLAIFLLRLLRICVAALSKNSATNTAPGAVHFRCFSPEWTTGLPNRSTDLLKQSPPPGDTFSRDARRKVTSLRQRRCNRAFQIEEIQPSFGARRANEFLSVSLTPHQIMPTCRSSLALGGMKNSTDLENGDAFAPARTFRPGRRATPSKKLGRKATCSSLNGLRRAAACSANRPDFPESISRSGPRSSPRRRERRKPASRSYSRSALLTG